MLFNMPVYAVISIALIVLLFILSFALKIVKRLRLTVPLIYLILLFTVLREWRVQHETLAIVILFGLIALVALSWIKSFFRFFRRF